MANKDDFAIVFAKLKAIFAPSSKKMDVAQDTKSYYLRFAKNAGLGREHEHASRAMRTRVRAPNPT